MISRIESVEVLRQSRHALALPESLSPLDECLIAGLVRRAAAYVCPCSARTLVRAALDGLRGTEPDEGTLEAQIEDAVDKALIAGDLLELSQVTTDDPAAKGTWLFAAPPSFLARPSGSVFLIGVSGDEPLSLPQALAARVEYDSHFRILRPQANEDLPQVLRDLGMVELSDQTWFRPPRQETASAMLSRFRSELSGLGAAGAVSELQILDADSNPAYYRGRWMAPKRHTGHFVARRPQAHGADIWGFALLEEGHLRKFLDFPRKHDRWRGADVAWHLQMAIDHERGAPQRYSLRPLSTAVAIDFFSPLPLWAERRLAVIGRPTPKQACLLSYQLAEAELATEEAFLRTNLWLAPVQSQGSA